MSSTAGTPVRRNFPWFLAALGLCLLAIAALTVPWDSLAAYLFEPLQYQPAGLFVELPGSDGDVSFTPLLEVQGNAEPRARVALYLNDTRVDSQVVDERGHFQMQATLPVPGSYRLRVSSIYRMGWRTWTREDERPVLRQSDPPPPPLILDLSEADRSGTYRINGRAEPNTWISVPGAPAGTGSGWTDLHGRFDLEYSPGRPITNAVLIAENARQHQSIPSQALNLQAAAQFTPTEEARLQQVQSDIDVQITSRAAIVRYSFALPASSTEVAQLLKGDLNGYSLMEAMRTSLYVNQQPGTMSLEQAPQVSVRDTAYVTLTQDFTSALPVMLLGNTDLTLSSPTGLPALGNRGRFRLAVADYVVTGVSPVPTLVDGQTYVWQGTHPQEITLRLSGDRLAALGVLPQLTLRDLIPAPALLRDGGLLLYQLIICLPMLWLLWLIGYSGLMRNLPHARQVSTYLLLASALAAGSRLWWLAYDTGSALRQSSLLAWMPTLPRAWYAIVSPDDVRAWVVLLALAALGSLVALAVPKPRRPWSGFSLAVVNFLAISAGLLLVTQVAGVMIYGGLLALGVADPPGYELAAWAASLGLLLYVSARSWSLLSSLIARRRAPLDPARRRGLVAVVCALAAVAALPTRLNVYLVSGGDLDFSTKLTNILQALFSSLATVLLYLGVAAAILLMGELWRGKRLEDVLRDDVPPSGRVDAAPATAAAPAAPHPEQSLLRGFGLILFAGFIVGPDDVWLLVPVSLLLAIPAYRLLIARPGQNLQLTSAATQVHERRKDLTRAVVSEMAIRQLIEKRDDLAVDLARGKIEPGEYEKKQLENQQSVELLEKNKVELLGEAHARDVVFAIGPTDQPWRNALLAVRYGFLLQLPLLVLYTGFYLAAEVWKNHPYIWLAVGIQELVFSARWLLISFFFGFFYELIRGNDGLKKGLFLAGAIALATLPYALLTLPSTAALPAITFRLGQMAAFTAALGLAFDWTTLRACGYPFRQLRLIVGEIPSLVTLTSIVAGTAAIVTTELLKGQVTALLTQVLKDILPTVSTIAPR